MPGPMHHIQGKDPWGITANIFIDDRAMALAHALSWVRLGWTGIMLDGVPVEEEPPPPAN